MSSLYGILSRRDRTLASLENLEAMLAATSPRPGDEWRSFVDPESGVALAYRHSATFGNERLSPAWHEDKSIVAAVDGDIFGAKSDPDAQKFANRHAGALVETYRANNDAFCHGLDGFFTAVIWDRPRQVLHLASDPMGHKLLFTFHEPARDLLVFATELPAVLRHPAVPVELDESLLPVYLSRGSLEPPLTLLRGIRKLRAGERQFFGPNGIDVERYWRPEILKGPVDFDFWKAELRREFLHTTERLTGGAGRVGVFLSGGIDSSVVLAALRTVDHREAIAFTLAYEDTEGEYDIPWAHRVAENTNTPHQTLVISPERAVTPEVVTTVMNQLGEPFRASSRAFNEYFLCSAAAEAGVRSVLNGAAPAFRQYREPPAQTVPPGVRSWDETVGRSLSQAQSLSKERIEAAMARPPSFDALQQPWLANREVLQGLEASQAIAVGSRLNVSTGRGCLFFQYVAPLFGVEERSPYVDARLAMTCVSVPGALNGSESAEMEKALLKEAFRDVLRLDFNEREKRAYPSLPLPSWLRRVIVPSLAVLAEDGILRPEYLTWLERNFQAGRHRARIEAWMWFAFAWWYQTYVKRKNPLQGLDLP